MIGHVIPAPLMLVILGVIGAIVGRFLNVCIRQFPRYDRLRDQLRAVAKPQAVCHRCAARPSLTERLPIVGWLLSSRRCHACQSRLSMEWPLVELITALLFAVVYWCEVPTGSTAELRDSCLVLRSSVRGPETIETLWSPSVWLHMRYALHMLMICGLIVATGIDRRERIIPDGSTIPVLGLSIILSGALGQLFIVPVWFQDVSTVRVLKPLMPEWLQPMFVPWDPQTFMQTSPHLHGILVSVLGMAAGAGAVWMVRQIGFLVLKQEAMGFGDVVLMGMIGSVIGWQPVLTVFMIAPTLAIFAAAINWFAHRDNEIPYGPFLSAATVVLLLFWQQIWPLAARFFDMGPFLALMLLFMIVLLAGSLQLVQLIKRLVGLGLPDEFDDGGWSSADHLSYYNSERPDEQTGLWQVDQWPGVRAGRGLQREHNWRRGS